MGRVMRVGTRGSALALAQTRAVVALLEQALGKAPAGGPGDALRGVTFEPVVIRTEGDRSGAAAPSTSSVPPSRACRGAAGKPFGAGRVASGSSPEATRRGVGVFVREIESALTGGRVDVAVHSMKDVPTSLARGTVIAAAPERADPRDVLISRDGLALDDLPPGGRVGTSSARRRAQLLRARPDLETVPVRGNVDTRLRKLAEGRDGMCAIVLAAAGLQRMGLIERATEFLPLERFVPPAGQAAIAVQVRADDAAAREVVALADHADTRFACEAERSFMAALGAGCRTPVGAHARVEGGEVKLAAAVYSADGGREVRGVVSGPAREASAVGARLAGELGAKGACDLLAAARERAQ